MKILFLPKYHEEGSSSRYRIHNYLGYFIAEGHQIEVRSLFHNGYVKTLYQKKTRPYWKIFLSYLRRVVYLLKNKHQFDVLLIEKELFPNCPYFLEAWLLKDCCYTLDFDDAVSTIYKGYSLKRFLLGEKINKLAKRAKTVTVGNHWYWNEISTGNLKYVPTVIDLDQYQRPCPGKPENSMPVIVWIGSPFTIRYVKSLIPVFQKLAEEYCFQLRVIGAEIAIAGVNLECLPWSQEKEFELLYLSDIGIMPLDSTVWEKGKCGFKLIQYMASLLPTVASPAPANEEIVINGETGFIARNDTEWYEMLSMLLKNPALRTQMGATGRKRVEAVYSYQVWGRRLVHLVTDGVK
jgi:glycosyltransferase involved in cell wall biosynthesis